MTPEQHKQNVQDKLKGLKGYVDRLANSLHGIDLSKPHQNIEQVESFLMMMQGQKEFVKQALQQMRDEVGK